MIGESSTQGNGYAAGQHEPAPRNGSTAHRVCRLHSDDCHHRLNIAHVDIRSMLGWYAFPTDDVSLLPTRVVGSQARRRRQAAAAAKARLVDPDKALKVEDIAPHGYAIERATVRQKETAQPCVSRSPSKHIKRSMTTSAPRTEKPGDFLLAAPRRSPVRVGMEDARAGAKPRLTYRDLRRRSGDLVLERAKPKRPCNDCAMRTSA